MKLPTHLTYFVDAAASLVQAGNQEADDDEAEDQQSRHHQAQERHVARTVPDVGGRRDRHGYRGKMRRLHLQDTITQYTAAITVIKLSPVSQCER